MPLGGLVKGHLYATWGERAKHKEEKWDKEKRDKGCYFSVTLAKVSLSLRCLMTLFGFGTKAVACSNQLSSSSPHKHRGSAFKVFSLFVWFVRVLEFVLFTNQAKSRWVRCSGTLLDSTELWSSHIHCWTQLILSLSCIILQPYSVYKGTFLPLLQVHIKSEGQRFTTRHRHHECCINCWLLMFCLNCSFSWVE